MRNHEKRCLNLECSSFLSSLFYRNRPKSSRIAIEKEGHMQNIVFDAPFLDEDKVKNGQVVLFFLLLYHFTLVHTAIQTT